MQTHLRDDAVVFGQGPVKVVVVALELDLLMRWTTEKSDGTEAGRAGVEIALFDETIFPVSQQIPVPYVQGRIASNPHDCVLLTVHMMYCITRTNGGQGNSSVRVDSLCRFLTPRKTYQLKVMVVCALVHLCSGYRYVFFWFRGLPTNATQDVR